MVAQRGGVINMRWGWMIGRIGIGVVFAAALLLPRQLPAFEKSLRVGANIGYSANGRREALPPDTVHGAAFGFFLTYGITDSIGVSIDGSLDWHPAYRVYTLGEVPAPDATGPDDLVVGHVADYQVTRSYLSELALSVVYVIDVMDLLPFLLLGVSGARQDRIAKREAEKGTLIEYQGGYVVGVRFGLGFDYMLLEQLGLGAQLASDIFLTNQIEFKGRLTVLARVTLVFDVSNFGSDE